MPYGSIGKPGITRQQGHFLLFRKKKEDERFLLETHRES